MLCLRPLVALTTLVLITAAIDASAQIYRLADLNTRQIQALDRQHTAVVIPGGILEEHGPYLPAYTDGYAIEAYARELSRAIVARPGWTVLVFPQIPILKPVFLCCGTKEQFLAKDALTEEGFTVHAGADEHSQLFYLRPDLIAPDFIRAPSLTARTFEDHVTIAKADGWPGYFGCLLYTSPSPRDS